VSHKINLRISLIKRGSDKSDLHKLVVILLELNKKNLFYILWCDVEFSSSFTFWIWAIYSMLERCVQEPGFPCLGFLPPFLFLTLARRLELCVGRIQPVPPPGREIWFPRLRFCISQARVFLLLRLGSCAACLRSGFSVFVRSLPRQKIASQVARCCATPRKSRAKLLPGAVPA
jgi:hypothetical protein